MEALEKQVEAAQADVEAAEATIKQTKAATRGYAVRLDSLGRGIAQEDGSTGYNGLLLSGLFHPHAHRQLRRQERQPVHHLGGGDFVCDDPDRGLCGNIFYRLTNSYF